MTAVRSCPFRLHCVNSPGTGRMRNLMIVFQLFYAEKGLTYDCIQYTIRAIEEGARVCRTPRRLF